jgi:Ca2+/Na+ antiporter
VVRRGRGGEVVIRKGQLTFYVGIVVLCLVAGYVMTVLGMH